jgi:hypothetical protein
MVLVQFQSPAQDKKDKGRRLQKLVYTVWNIWKERCRRVFGNRAMIANQLTDVIKEDVQLWNRAWSRSADQVE